LKTKQKNKVVEVLLQGLDPPLLLSPAEAYAALLELDRDHNGSLDLDELLAWWAAGKPNAGGGGDSSSSSSSSNSSSSSGGRAVEPWIYVAPWHGGGWLGGLRAASLVAGALFAIGGAVGVGTEAGQISADGWAADHGGWVCVFGVFKPLWLSMELLGCTHTRFAAPFQRALSWNRSCKRAL
jgi:hypothetical protein